MSINYFLYWEMMNIEVLNISLLFNARTASPRERENGTASPL